MDRKWEMKVPASCYNIDQYKYDSFDEHVETYTNMHLPNISQEDITHLKNKTKYLRFMCFQDTPTSEAYMYAYCRPVAEMLPEHFTAADIANIPKDHILGEINYRHNAYFFIYKLT